MIRKALLAVAVLVVALHAVGAGAFTGVTADRNVGVAVVSDDRAYFGVDTHDHTVTAGNPETVALADLENRFPYALEDADVSVTGDGPTPPVLQRVDASHSLGVGESDPVTARKNCNNGVANSTTETWTVSITASGDGVEVRLCPSLSRASGGLASIGRPDPRPRRLATTRRRIERRHRGLGDPRTVRAALSNVART